jgi:hypothetical protein
MKNHSDRFRTLAGEAKRTPKGAGGIVGVRVAHPNLRLLPG